MGFWKGLSGLIGRLKPETTFTNLPRPPPSTPKPPTPPTKATKQATKKKLYAVPRVRKQHEIFTDVSRHEAGTTFAGVWNPHPGGTVQDAFRVTYPNSSTPLKLGNTTVYLPSANVTLSEAYAVYIALSLWKHKLQGGDVKCIGDNSTAVAVLATKGSGILKFTENEGKMYQRQALQAIAAANADIALKYNITLEFSLVNRLKNKLPHNLSRSWSKEEMAKLDKQMMWQVRGNERKLKQIHDVGLASESFMVRLFREFADLGGIIKHWARNKT